MSLIGRRWKCREACSWPILISRGLDLQKLWEENAGACKQKKFVSLFGFQGAEQRISKINSEPSEAGLNWRGSTTKWVSFRRRWKRRIWSLCWRDAPLAQLVEQLTLNQWVPGSNPWRRTIWPVGQAVKTAASHAANMGSIPVRVTNQISNEIWYWQVRHNKL